MVYRAKSWFGDEKFDDFDGVKRHLMERLGLSEREAESYVKDFYDCEREVKEELEEEF